ncbi:MAG: hypothetical protein D6675_13245 [Gemmatimonadetes bacterium]|nr:MAG: hypothetical protein D6675_13245 [Gemmatimonadota bacterium]
MRTATFNPQNPVDRIDYNIAKLKALEYLVSNTLGEYEEGVAIQVSNFFDDVIVSLEDTREEMKAWANQHPAKRVNRQPKSAYDEVTAHLGEIWNAVSAPIYPQKQPISS